MPDNIPIMDALGVRRTISTNTLNGIHRPVYSKSQDGPIMDGLYRSLDTNGDGTGDFQAIGDYSGTVTPFFIAPPPGAVYRIARMIVHIEDVGSMDSGKYGNSIDLTEGIIVTKTCRNVQTTLTDRIIITRNPHWKIVCHDEVPSSYGTGAENLSYRWTFSKGGQMIRLDGDFGDRLDVVLNDNFTGLTGHTFFVHGYIE